MTSNNKAVKGCGGLPFLYTENPRRLILGNRYFYARIAYSRRRQMQVNICLLNDLPGRHQPPVAGCGEAPYVCSVSFLEEFFSETHLQPVASLCVRRGLSARWRA